MAIRPPAARPFGRSADDVVRALDAGGKEQAARMSHQKVAHYALTASTVRTVSEQRSLGARYRGRSPARSWPFVAIAAPPSSVVPASVALIRAASRFLRFLGGRDRLLGRVRRRCLGRRCHRRGHCIERCGMR